MVEATCFQRLYMYGIIKFADFHCERVIRREATETEGPVEVKNRQLNSYHVHEMMCINKNNNNNNNISYLMDSLRNLQAALVTSS